jgi:thiol-disulfide isomerase/thioredoxin
MSTRTTLSFLITTLVATCTLASPDLDFDKLIPFENKPVWGEGEASGKVIFMNDKHFDSYKIRNSGSSFLTFFYAPWCGHCKAMKPEFAKASLETEVPLLAMDCTSDGQATCNSYDVTGYPTIKFFQGGEASEFSGARTKSGILKFLKKKDPNWKPEPFENKVPEDWNATEGLVIHMDDDHFEDYSKEQGKRFVAFFYAPWCGHCRASKDGYSVASTKFRRSMPFLAIDCTDQGSATCTKYKIDSYPQFKYFEHGNEPENIEVAGDSRSSGTFISFVEKKLDTISEQAAAAGQYNKLRVKQLRKMLKARGLICRGCTEKKHFVQMVKNSIDAPLLKKKTESGKKRKSLMQEKRELLLSVEAKQGWNDEEYGNGAIIHSHDGDFEENILTGALGQNGVLVFFYAKWCGHCKAAKPDIVEVSKELEAAGVKQRIVAIDADGSKEIAQKYKITSFPTWHYFVDSKMNDDVFNGANPSSVLTGRKKLLAFMMKLHDPNWEPPPPPPFINKPVWGEKEKSGNVIFMDDDHFNEFRSNNKQYLIKFYAPWCGHCKAMKPKYASASMKATVPMVAMDCTSDGKETCQTYGVNGYPTLKWFDSNYDDPENCNVREEEDILNFIETRTAADYKREVEVPTTPPKKEGKENSEKKRKKLTKEEKSLLNAAKEGNLKIVQKMIQKKKIKIETASKDGYTSLIYASAKGHGDIVSFLLSQGANKKAVDIDGVSALDYAKKKGHKHIIKLLEGGGEGEEEEDDFEDVKEDL